MPSLSIHRLPRSMPVFVAHGLRNFGLVVDLAASKEISRIFQSELLAHGTNIGIKVLALRGDYSKDAVAQQTTGGEDQA
jgi:hypothetical protein